MSSLSREVLLIVGIQRPLLYWQVYAPIIMLIPAVLTIMRCYSRVLSKLGLAHEDADEWGGDEELEEGRILIKRAQEGSTATDNGQSGSAYVQLE